MNPIIYVSTDLSRAYNDESFIGRIKDRLRINIEGESFVRELNLKIARVKLPPNFNQKAYMNNIAFTKRYVRKERAFLAPKTSRYLDFNILNNYQKSLFAYGIVNSIKLLLRIRNKSIKFACIVIYDASDEINYEIILELAKECKYCILLSDDLEKANSLSDYVLANYGISPIVSNCNKYALNKADFIISSRDIETTNPVWYINNMFIPKNTGNLAVNDISFSVPWEVKDFEFGFEVLGAILSQMQIKDIETSLKYNGIYLDKIKFNNEIRY
jgi:hypothetical protein